MSIIHEALKKAQKERLWEVPKAAEPFVDSSPEPPVPAAKNFSFYSIFLSGIILSIICLGIYLLAWDQPRDRKITILKPTAVPPAPSEGAFSDLAAEEGSGTAADSLIETELPQVAVQTPVETETGPEMNPVTFSPISDYKLNGIVFDQKDSYVIINNQVLATGERIDAATVVNIEENKVRLALDGVEHVLAL